MSANRGLSRRPGKRRAARYRPALLVGVEVRQDRRQRLADQLRHRGPVRVAFRLVQSDEGARRYTADVDATITSPQEPLERMCDVFAQHRIVPRIAGALAFARDRQVMLLRHEPSEVDLDVSLAWLPFELDAIGRSEVIDYAGVAIRIPRPDDLVIYKLVAARPATSTGSVSV